MLGGQAAIDIDHPEARCPVGVEQDTVLIDGRTDDRGVLQNRIDRRQFLGYGRNEPFHLQIQITGHRQVRLRRQPDPAVHEDVFVIPFAAVLRRKRTGQAQQDAR